MSKHLDDWTWLWKEAERVFTQRNNWDRITRESFELIEAALIYHRNALAMYTPEDGGLHRPLRASTPGAAPSFAWSSKEPLFSEIRKSADVKLGNSFIASASFRLPVAVLKAIETSVAPFARFLNGDGYWNLDALSTCFKDVKKLGCCKTTTAPGTSRVTELKNAIAIVLVHRDDFGHGEVGFPHKGSYRTQREEILNSLYVCRILQAQRELSRWVLARLDERR
jgi:hypothetical protein